MLAGEGGLVGGAGWCGMHATMYPGCYSWGCVSHRGVFSQGGMLVIEGVSRFFFVMGGVSQGGCQSWGALDMAGVGHGGVSHGSVGIGGGRRCGGASCRQGVTTAATAAACQGAHMGGPLLTSTRCSRRAGCCYCHCTCLLLPPPVWLHTSADPC